MKQKIIDFLLSNADPSIVIRVKKEVLNCISKNENKTLLDKIIPQKNVQAEALNKLFSFEHDREKMVYTKIKNFYKGPCLAFIHNQIYCLGLMDENYINFDLMELFARCGVVKQVDFLKNKYEYLLTLVNDDLSVNYKVSARERDWGPYGGFALEEDWKTKTRKQCDLLFRILIIMHYAECID